MRAILFVLMLIGLAAICNDTRGAQWLVFPGVLAGVVLVGTTIDRMHNDETAQ